MVTAEPEGFRLQAGIVLRVSPGTWGGYPAPTFTYQWERCRGEATECEEIVNATGAEYTVSGRKDEGMSLQVKVTATNAAGRSTIVSEATEIVAAGELRKERAPAISGTAAAGRVLSATSGSWSGPIVSTHYQWEDCTAVGEACAPIPGATGATYIPTPLDIGDRLRVTVDVTNDASEAGSAISATSAVVTAGPQYLGTLEAPSEGFAEPSDVALGTAGALWVLNRGNSRIDKCSEEARCSYAFGTPGSGEGQLKSPDGLAVDEHGNIWVADTGNNRVQEFSPTGAVLRAIEDEGATAVTVDHEGNVWVAGTKGLPSTPVAVCRYGRSGRANR